MKVVPTGTGAPGQSRIIGEMDIQGTVRGEGPKPKAKIAHAEVLEKLIV